VSIIAPTITQQEFVRAIDTRDVATQVQIALEATRERMLGDGFNLLDIPDYTPQLAGPFAAGDRHEGGDRCREEAAMTLWWIGDVVLLVVVLPVVVYLLRAVLGAAKSIVPSVQEIAKVAAEGSKDLDAAVLLLTTQDQVTQTVAGVANYGGSLDVILDDA